MKLMSSSSNYENDRNYHTQYNNDYHYGNGHVQSYNRNHDRSYDRNHDLYSSLSEKRGGKNRQTRYESDRRSRSRSRDRVNNSRQSFEGDRNRSYRYEERKISVDDHYDHRVQDRRINRHDIIHESDPHSNLGFDRNNHNQRSNDSTVPTMTTAVATVEVPIDSNLKQLEDDPRRTSKGKMVKAHGGGRNTTSFDPTSTLVRPAMRVIIEKNTDVLERSLTHDDVVIVPNFLAEEEDWSLYYKLIEEIRESQSMGEKDSEWISWHEGTHLISKNPTGSSTYKMIQEKISKFFNIPMNSVGTRFNWYRDSSDWKPFHHDSAAFNPTRARNQNITVGISLGATRELSFLHASNETTLSFPQTNGMLFSFGRDVNIRWKHGIRAIDPEDQKQDGRGRISIILWGKCPDIKEEADSPPMLPYEGHERNSSSSKGKEVCRDFIKNSCRYGDSCRFIHHKV